MKFYTKYVHIHCLEFLKLIVSKNVLSGVAIGTLLVAECQRVNVNSCVAAISSPVKIEIQSICNFEVTPKNRPNALRQLKEFLEKSPHCLFPKLIRHPH